MGDPKNDSERPRTHVVGDTAVNGFNYRRPQEWVVINSTQSDYGWDLFLTLVEDETVTKEDFFVHLKGSDSTQYIKDGTAVSHSLETGRIRWLFPCSYLAFSLPPAPTPDLPVHPCNFLRWSG